MKSYCTYILASKRNGTLYVGVTSDLPSRISMSISKNYLMVLQRSITLPHLFTQRSFKISMMLFIEKNVSKNGTEHGN